MRILVAGATGAIGRRLVPRLVAAGHAVTGLTRSPAKVEALSGAGAAATVVDALDFAAVRAALLDARPEVVIHEMTAISNASDLAHFDRGFAATNRLRTDGVDYLLAAARECGARRFIAQSFCGWPFARMGGPVKTWWSFLHVDDAAAWFCAMESSTDRAPGCSMERSSISSAAGASP